MAKQLTLDFAYMCLKNALNLLPNTQQIFSKTASKQANGGDVALRSSSLSKFDDETTIGDDSAVGEGVGESGVDQSTIDLLSPNSSFKANVSSTTTTAKKQNMSSQLRYKLFNCVWPSRPLNIAQLQNLRSCVLVSLAYCSLCIRDFQSTVKYASIVLDQDDPLNLKCPPSNGNR